MLVTGHNRLQLQYNVYKINSIVKENVGINAVMIYNTEAISCLRISGRNLCGNNPCSNGGQCTNGVSTYYCRCPGDRAGQRCEQCKCN